MLRAIVRPTCAAINSARGFVSDIRYGGEARESVQQGADLVADAVGTTLGPQGRTAVIERVLLSPQITKDGLAVAKAVLALKDNRRNLGAQLMCDVASKTNNEVGDGTSTASLLARAILKQGFELVAQGVNPHEIRAGILMATRRVCVRLARISRQVLSVEQFGHVALVATNGDEQIAKLIRKAFSKLGRDGVFLVKKGSSVEDKVEIVQGVHFNSGFMSLHFVESTRDAKVEYSRARLLLSAEKIDSVQAVLPALELAHRLKQPLLIVAPDIEGDALLALLINRLKLQLAVCAVKTPDFGQSRNAFLGDLALATGAKIFDCESMGSNTPCAHVGEHDLGKLRDLVITKDRTVFLRDEDTDSQALEARSEEIREQISAATTEGERDALRRRLACLSTGLAIICVGGTSDVEVEEKSDRINDALNALRAATREGIVPGGGTAYLRCLPALGHLSGANREQNQGIAIVRNALRVPCMTIARNAGVDGGEVVERVLGKHGNYGYDAVTNSYCNLVARGIIDPTAVVRSAITDAAGVASMLITTEATITEPPWKPRGRCL